MVWLTPVLGIVMMCVECVEGAPKKVGQKAGTNQQTRQEKSTKKHRLRQSSGDTQLEPLHSLNLDSSERGHLPGTL